MNKVKNPLRTALFLTLINTPLIASASDNEEAEEEAPGIAMLRQQVEGQERWRKQIELEGLQIEVDAFKKNETVRLSGDEALHRAELYARMRELILALQK